MVKRWDKFLLAVIVLGFCLWAAYFIFESSCVSDIDGQRSYISLGLLEVYDRHNPSRLVTQHLHLREFEAPMSGALYCTGYMDELAEMFEPDKEVLVYRNQHELLDKVRYYLAHPAQAEQVRQDGWKRALRDHTYQRRFAQLFEELGLARL